MTSLKVGKEDKTGSFEDWLNVCCVFVFAHDTVAGNAGPSCSLK